MQRKKLTCALYNQILRKLLSRNYFARHDRYRKTKNFHRQTRLLPSCPSHSLFRKNINIAAGQILDIRALYL